MARHNFVNVIAFVQKKADFKDTLDGREGIIAMTTIMSPRDYFKAKTGYQCHSVHFCVRSDESRILDIFQELNLYTLVEINGFLATKEIEKRKNCPYCNTVNYRQEACVAYGKDKSGGNLVYVFPTSIRIIKKCDGEQEAYEYLHDNRNDVNRAFVIGNLTGEPVSGQLQGGSKIYTRYQVAVTRKYYTRSSSVKHERTDYPWIYSYQRKAEKDYETLKTGALVFIDGALQSRKFKEQYICSNCGKEYDVPGRTLEVLAYDTEYLRLPGFDGGSEYPDVNGEEYEYMYPEGESDDEPDDMKVEETEE